MEAFQCTYQRSLTKDDHSMLSLHSMAHNECLWISKTFCKDWIFLRNQKAFLFVTQLRNITTNLLQGADTRIQHLKFIKRQHRKPARTWTRWQSKPNGQQLRQKHRIIITNNSSWNRRNLRQPVVSWESCWFFKRCFWQAEYVRKATRHVRCQKHRHLSTHEKDERGER